MDELNAVDSESYGSETGPLTHQIQADQKTPFGVIPFVLPTFPTIPHAPTHQ